MIRTFALAFALCALAGTQAAHAGGTCQGAITEKKLSGAARTSFLKKCETDVKARCEATAGERKLSGAAKTSFTRKCVTDSIGA